MIDKIRKGIRNPNDALVYLLRQTIPASTLERAQNGHPKWTKKEDFYTFQEGGFAGGTGDRPVFCARNFYEIRQLRKIVGDIAPTTSAEIGSGYGRLSPWIAQFSSEHYGFEPNTKACNKAKMLYPNIQWRNEKIQGVSAENYNVDLIVTWTVLQHIPPSSIHEAIEKIKSMVSEQSYILICEETEGEAGSHTWPRDVEKYNELFNEHELLEVQTRELEPGYESHAGEIMIFERS